MGISSTKYDSKSETISSKVFVKHLIFTFVFIIKVLQFTSSEMTSLWNFSWVREKEVAASSAPKNSEDLQWLQSQGIKQVLCLDKDYIYVYKKPNDLNVKLIDIVEFEAPDSNTINSIPSQSFKES